MPGIEVPKEKWSGKVREVTLGATAANGGTRSRTVTVGGETTLPFLTFEGTIPHPPAIAIEVRDSQPTDWPSLLIEAWNGATQTPDAWAKAQAATEIIRTQLREQRIVHDELFVEHPGLDSAHGALSPQPSGEALAALNEVWTRLVLRTPDKAAAEGFGRLFPWLALSGPAYTCGFNGLHNVSELLGIWPTLIARAEVEPGVRIECLGDTP
jgi:hypothetical protein